MPGMYKSVSGVRGPGIKGPEGPGLRLKKVTLITPRAHARARGYVIGRGVYILYIYKSALFFGTNLISPKILTFRGLF